MATTPNITVSFLPPTRLDGYDRTRPSVAQPAGAAPPPPPLFVDAMAVREAVFVREQGVPLACEHDGDDARSCHWVAYSAPPAAPAPVGTLRVVPFPHPPHPAPGARYVDNVLQPPAADAAAGCPPSPPSPSPDAAAAAAADRPTAYHDGREPYVKLGRVAVVASARGLHVARRLWDAAARWLLENPDYFSAPPRDGESGEGEGGGEGRDVNRGRWDGLVCCHAQETVAPVYERLGFAVDEGMGRWFEEGIPHVGMFLRLPVKREAAI
ncbi:acyl-CoA N-acyltransferase [Durotheca rogersii]|uniref:acyl-CoA N-acyltransferase n=1 Tax=Durotheca rogersii TaxID=419775 RepID=UPI0022201216|nr:acyl-CoA N-acyltransferase [Durotheca rogersii]KAI5862403.1 acyl-CoA N-acyltransferase [Durotheca rogersii]